MYENALDITTDIELVPYDGITQRLVEGRFPGSYPIWVGAGTGDPTGEWNSRLVFGASGNLTHYNFKPVEDIVKTMKVTLDAEARREMATEVTYILLGEDERYGNRRLCRLLDHGQRHRHGNLLAVRERS